MLADYYISFLPPDSLMGFPRFRELPAELRLKIWQDALPGPRTIQLIKCITNISLPANTNTSEDEEYRLGQYANSTSPRCYKRNSVSHCVTTIRCPMGVLSLLRTCHESRLEVLCRYQPLFSPKSIHDSLFGLHFFDPLTDGIFIDEIWPWVRGGNSKPTGLFNARILSISCNAWFLKWTRSPSQLLGKGGLLRFRNLEELHIVHRILTDYEREKIMKYSFGQYMGPGDMTQYLRRPQEPHDIAFPSISVDIKVEPILARFAEMKAADPTWKVPKVKLIAWATRTGKSDLSI